METSACTTRAIRAGNKGFGENKRSDVSLNLKNLRGQIIIQTKKVLMMCKIFSGEVCKCLRRFAGI